MDRKGGQCMLREKIEKTCDELKDLLIEKNQKYGNSFFKTADEYGKTVLVLRIDDKLNRLKQLILHNETDDMQGENVKDTLIDLAGYAVLAKLYLDCRGGN